MANSSYIAPGSLPLAEGPHSEDHCPRIASLCNKGLCLVQCDTPKQCGRVANSRGVCANELTEGFVLVKAEGTGGWLWAWGWGQEVVRGKP